MFYHDIVEGIWSLMEQNRYLNEEQYQQNVGKLKRTGKTVLAAGICMFVLGAVFLFLGFTGFGKTALNPGQTAEGIFGGLDRKSTRLNSSHPTTSRMPSSA